MQTYPRSSGLYDPRFEHDACGVSFVAHMKGEALERARADRAPAPLQPRPPWRLRRRGQHRRRRRHPASRSPTASSAPWSGSPCRPPGHTPSASPSCRDEAACEKAQAQIEKIVVEEGLSVLGWRERARRPVVPRHDGAAP